jgi:hypothetical protein
MYCTQTSGCIIMAIVRGMEASALRCIQTSTVRSIAVISALTCVCSKFEKMHFFLDLHLQGPGNRSSWSFRKRGTNLYIQIVHACPGCLIPHPCDASGKVMSAGTIYLITRWNSSRLWRVSVISWVLVKEYEGTSFRLKCNTWLTAAKFYSWFRRRLRKQNFF